MKPSFALDFRATSIALLHRTQRGWMQVGEAAMDAPDLSEALSYLRATALGLSPRGISTKLVIPNDQILYTTVQAAGPDGAKKRRTIKAALEGLTPYAVEDLVYDWSGTGPEVQVAVIARETLAEAEAFAVEHRFNPISFVAIPEPGSFPREPWFGATALSPALLSEGEKVERDQEPISVIARELPRAEPKPVEPEPVDADKAEPEAVTPVAAAVDTPAAPAPAPVADLASAPSPAPVADPAPGTKAEPALREPLPETAYFNPLDLVEEAPMALDVPQPEPQPEAPRPAPPPPPVVERPSAGVLNPVIADDLPPPPSDAALMAFASRRAGDAPLTAPAPLAKAGPRGETAGLRVVADRNTTSAPERSALAKPLGSSDPAVQRAAAAASRAGAAKGGTAGKALRGLGGLGALVSGNSAGGIPGKRAKVNPPAPARPAISPTTGKSLGGGPSQPLGNVTRLAPGSTTSEAGAAAKPMARPAQKPLTGLGTKALPPPRPRYLGLILTGILLVFLALVAAWSTFFLARDDTAPAVEETGTALSDFPAPEDEMLADMQDPAEFEGIETPGSGEGEDLALTDPEPAAVAETAAVEPEAVLAQEPVAEVTEPALVEPEAVEPEAVEPVAAVTAPEAVVDAEAAPEPAHGTEVSSDLAVAASPSTTAQDEIFLAAMDAPPQTADPGALPQVVAAIDPLPQDPVPPPPFGTVYRFDADGRIVATPEGIMTPEGVLLVAGPPSILPPERPAALTVASAPAADVPAADLPATDAAPAGETAALPGGTLPETTLPLATDAAEDDIPRGADFPSDPALAGARPLPRPERLAPAAAQADDDASVAPAAGSRFASLRPLSRPEALTVASAVAATQSASLVNTGGDVLLASANVITTTSPMAVAVSRRPETRPADMSRAVEAAVAAATRAPEPQPEPEQTAAAQPAAKASAEADAEPELASVAPAVPTKASVAKQATYVNAINLSKLNLIGVYGTSSSRYALVRQSNGRYKKVKVGDSLDGGKVAAITDNELRYQKGGRMVTLELPTG